jgi:hypothetical protein
METRRPLSNATKKKVLECAAEILSMHGDIAGDRCCQDWSGKAGKNPDGIFSDTEKDDIEFNSQIRNSNSEDYEKGLSFFHDEMSVSFSMANILTDLASEL